MLFRSREALARGADRALHAESDALGAADAFVVADAPVADVSAHVYSLWKWNAAARRWAFHSPQLGAEANAAYRATHGYDALVTIEPREGFWVSATQALSLASWNAPAAAFTNSHFQALPAGWNLLSIGQRMSPTAFNNDVAQADPPAPTGLIANFASLWSWSADDQGWYFYAASLEANGGLDAVRNYEIGRAHV